MTLRRTSELDNLGLSLSHDKGRLRSRLLMVSEVREGGDVTKLKALKRGWSWRWSWTE